MTLVAGLSKGGDGHEGRQEEADAEEEITAAGPVQAGSAPDYVVSLSGGTGSFASACIAHERGLNYTMVFADTLIEDEDLHRFLRDIERVLGRRIIRLVDGRTPWEVFRDVGFIGNSRTAPCSHHLKRLPIRAWLDENAPDAALVIGMGLDEPDRLERAKAAWAPRQVLSLLAEEGWTNQDAQSCYSRYGIRRPRLYERGFPHNNCSGGCVRAGQQAWAALLRTAPEVYAYHEHEEAAALASIPGALPILRDRTAGATSGVTLAEFRERKNRQPEMFDWGGCGCFVDDGMENAR